MSLNIFVVENTELINDEYFERGLRADIFVKINNIFYNIIAYDLQCFNEEIMRAINKNDSPLMDNNIFIIKEITIKEIIKSILNNHKNQYFEKALPCKVIDKEIYYSQDKRVIDGFILTKTPIYFKEEELIRIY